MSFHRGLAVKCDRSHLTPFDPFTHPNVSLDRLKRTVLEQQMNIRLVFLENVRLIAGDFQVIEDGLRGIDTSDR